MRFLFSALLLGFSLVAPVHGQVKLEWKFKEGQKFYLEENNTLKQTIEFMGNKQPQKIETTSVYGFTVKKTDKDGTVIEQKIESMKVNSDGGINPLDKMGDQLKGVTFTVTLTPTGKITKFEGYEDMIKKLNPKNNDMVGKMLKAMLTEDTMKQGAAQAFGYLPEKSVNKGDQWKNQLSLPLGPLGTFESDNRYTYEGKGTEGEEISVKPTLSYKPSKDGSNPLPFKITKGEFKADDAKGKIIFDTAAGRLVRQEMLMKVSGSLTIEIGGMESTMKLEQDQVSKIRVLDKAPE